MERGRVVPLTSPLALNAAEWSLEHGLPLADSVIFATARAFDATLWTQDEHFRGLDGVEYISK